jgi:hypothetical protein
VRLKIIIGYTTKPLELVNIADPIRFHGKKGFEKGRKWKAGFLLTFIISEVILVCPVLGALVRWRNLARLSGSTAGFDFPPSGVSRLAGHDVRKPNDP